ncbi:MAG: LicD family protein [Lachnospiraceae bacterium]|nr:LicD family protein [Lachnospiraceae bacterium]
MPEKLDFKTTETYTKEDVRQVQLRLLEMAKIMADILDREGYRYIMAFGTLLGAVRHKGFIPWDDDFDVFIFNEEYEEAIQCLRDKLPKDLIVHDKKTDPIYWPAWSRLRDLHSHTRAVLFPDDNCYKYTGINLDLYRLKKMRRDDVKLWKKKSAIEFLVRKHEAGILPDETYQERFDQWTADYTQLLQNKPGIQQEEEVYSALNPTLPEPIKVKDIFPLKKYSFEDTAFWGPNNADAVLKLSFGDYMQIPPYEQRHAHYTEVGYDN